MVKCVDVHPTEPWVLSCLYDGTIHIYDYTTESVVKSFEVSDQPVRCGVFVARKQWIICGCDDMFMRVYNYNTMEKVDTFEAHMDYIRSLCVHPTLPLMVTASDDMLIKLWDWEKGWANTMVFEGHEHYVMQVLFNPKDPSTFASASLDHTIKVWNIGSPAPNLTLEGHEKGVNCIDYYAGADNPYLVSGSDDQTVKMWDYQTRSCVQTLEYHQHNVSCVSFIQDRPLILSGSEDGSVVLWNSSTYKNELVMQHNLERCWAASHAKGLNSIALGYDLGTVVIKLGKDVPLVSMDNSGKVIYIRQTEVTTTSVRTVDFESLPDGERLPVVGKELGSTENSPQSILHSPNGRFVAVCGDGEYIIYTALAWRNKSYGSADEVVWDFGPGEFATRRGNSDIRIHSKMFKERAQLQLGFPADGIFGGNLLAVRSADGGSPFACFFDWESLQLIRRIDVLPTHVYWSDSDLVAVATDTSLYILQFDRAIFEAELDRAGGALGPDGAEEAFQLVQEFPEVATSGCWMGDCFIFASTNNRVNYVLGAEISLLHHVDATVYVLGYLASEGRVFVADKDVNICSFKLSVGVLDYKTAVVRGNLEQANAVLANVPKTEHNKLAKFLEKQGMKEEALALATDADYRCDLAISLGKLDLAIEVVRGHPSKLKWNQLGELAVHQGRLELAEECMKEGDDVSGLLTLATAMGNVKAVEDASQRAVAGHANNVAFLVSFMKGDVDRCLEILVDEKRLPEAALFARSYCPSNVAGIVQQWRSELRKTGDVRAAGLIADPTTHGHLFEDFEASLAAEARSMETISRMASEPASSYPAMKEALFSGLDGGEVPAK